MTAGFETWKQDNEERRIKMCSKDEDNVVLLSSLALSSVLPTYYAQMRGNLTGVIAAVLGNVVIALGLNFQKLCHIQIEGSVDRDTDTEQPQPEFDATTIKPSSTNPLLRAVQLVNERVQESLDRDAQYLSHPTFWLGLSLTTIGESSNFIAYGLSPAPLVAPLGSCALVANCLFSPLLLGESFGLQEVVGSALCIIGAFVLIASNTGRDGKVCL